MSVNLTPSRSPSGSPAFSPANRPVYRGGAVAGGAPVAGYDPANLPWGGPGVIRRWWHADEATFMNGGVPAVPGVPGDPVSSIVSQASVATFNVTYFGGSSPTLRSDGPGTFFDPKGTTVMLSALPSAIAPKDTGVTFFGRYFVGAGSGVDADAWIFGQDYSPPEAGATIVQTGGVFLRVYGNTGSYADSPDLTSYVGAGGETLGFIIVPDAGGSCTVKFFTDSSTPVGTGTITTTGSISRSIEYKSQACKAAFFGGQDFSANVDDILNFLNNGSGA